MRQGAWTRGSHEAKFLCERRPPPLQYTINPRRYAFVQHNGASLQFLALNVIGRTFNTPSGNIGDVLTKTMRGNETSDQGGNKEKSVQESSGSSCLEAAVRVLGILIAYKSPVIPIIPPILFSLHQAL